MREELINKMCDASPILGLIKPGMIMAEVGVNQGKSTLEFLQRGAFVYIIDLWESYDPFHKMWDHFQAVYAVLDKIKNYGERYHIIRDESKKAVEFIKYKLDVVFIDADHSYENVKKDIEAYWPLVKEGGWLTGHDYHQKDVKKAVDEFCQNIGKSGQLKLFSETVWGLQK